MRRRSKRKRGLKKNWGVFGGGKGHYCMERIKGRRETLVGYRKSCRGKSSTDGFECKGKKREALGKKLNYFPEKRRDHILPKRREAREPRDRENDGTSGKTCNLEAAAFAAG